ncbi:MAG: AraC family transcriptional regulator [Corticimicrobacter sp.]|uniref:AraC family transcriptional regulator n=1 Tax=Corticimicrobacter sp. TaxID=2678536 RepID=UPI0032DA1903
MSDTIQDDMAGGGERGTRFWHDPAMPHVESRRACASRACYRPHSHPTWSIGAVDAGRSRFSADRVGTVPIGPGTLVFVPAGHVHACNPEPGAAWSYQMLHLDDRWVRRVLSMPVALRGDAQVLSGHRVGLSHDPARYARFCALNDLLFSAAPVATKDRALQAFLVEGLVGAAAIEPLAQAVQLAPVALVPVMQVLQSAQVPVPLAELAAVAGMNRYRLIRVFRAATGMTPHAWWLNDRINQGRMHLRAGRAIAEVAHGLGFSDQSHFQRMFKAHAGATPGCYR